MSAKAVDFWLQVVVEGTAGDPAGRPSADARLPTLLDALLDGNRGSIRAASRNYDAK